MTCKDVTSTSKSTTSDILIDSVRNYLRVQHAFTECSDEIQAVVRDMIEVFNSPESTDEERNGALYTMVEAIFPEVAEDICRTCEQLARSPKAREHNERLRRQDQVFADNVRRIMQKKGITQNQLAESIGIGQSAISNLLKRNCRPQKRTIHKIAMALGVATSDLWINLERDTNSIVP